MLSGYRRLVGLVLLSLMIAVSPVAAQSRVPNIAFGGRDVGVVERLSLEASGDPSTVLLRVEARLTEFADVLDQVLGARGNILGGCSSRLHWAGETSVRGYGDALSLSSRVRYEQWVCGFLGDHRVFRDTKTVEWRLFVEADRLDSVRISAQVENVRSLQNDLEQILGLRVREDVAIPLPTDCGTCSCDQVIEALLPALEDVRFEDAGEGDMRVVVTFSAANDLKDILQCL